MPNRQTHPKPHQTNPCQTCHIRKLRQQTQPGAKLHPQCKFDILTELEIICAYCKENSSIQLAQQKEVDSVTIRNIIRRHGKKPRNLSEAQRLRRKSPPLHFPLSTQVPTLHQNPQCKPYLPHLIAVCLLTDGSAGRRQTGQPYITFTNKAQTLHAIFADLIHHAYGATPSAYYKPYWSHPKRTGSKAYYTTYFRKQETSKILQNLQTLTPTFRTRPKRGQTWQEYLKEKPQPTLQFLLKPNIPRQILIFAIRLAMSAEASIYPKFTNSGKPSPRIDFGCYHPTLRQQWKTLFSRLGLDLIEGPKGLHRTQITTAIRFLQLGGFLPGIKIRKGSYYEGLTRQQVLRATILAHQQNIINPTKPLPEKHTLLRQYAATIQEQAP